MIQTRRPVIGITVDSEEGGGYSAKPWYALRKNYAQTIVDAGGLPLLLPHQVDLVDAYLDRIDGLLITGGHFDVDPALFGEGARHETVKLKPGRTDFELAVARGAMERDMPVLGICGGQQLLAVALGGTLIQHIPDSVVDPLAHEQPNPRDEPGHPVHLREGTLLHRIVQVEEMQVNSAHHQAVRSVPAPVLVNAVAPDGVIEGIEDPTRPFCLGVQWHPEYHVDPGDRLILDAFVAASRR